MSAKLGEKAMKHSGKSVKDIFAVTTPARKTKKETQRIQHTPTKNEKTGATPAREISGGASSTPSKPGRPVVLEDWKRISIVFEQRHIDAMDAAIYAKKTNTRKRYSYSDVVRWLVDKHLNDF